LDRVKGKGKYVGLIVSKLYSMEPIAAKETKSSGLAPSDDKIKCKAEAIIKEEAEEEEKEKKKKKTLKIRRIRIRRIIRIIIIRRRKGRIRRTRRKG
jgi:hypothetical protein